MELREDSVREWVENRTLNVLHVSGRINPADIFTKEMQDGAHFRRLQDSFMCCLSDFLQQSLLLLVIHHKSQLTSHTNHRQVVPSAASSYTIPAQNSYFKALCSIPLCRTFSTISHLLSTGRQLIRRLHHIVLSGLL